ncbi:hypothetical protein BD769DRAFT_1625676 [Suillus cothurnatus]|nr:hypothetical protein BD769DRAFT_1625676 [Suillus cothurnatus]
MAVNWQSKSLGPTVHSSSSSNPFIPSGISQGCSDYLTSLDSNSSFSSCTAPIISATSAFAPGVNSSSITTSILNTALSNLCSASAFDACPESTVRSQLMSYYSACSAELTTNLNDAVLRTYDVLYALTPLREAVCALSDNGKYCVTQLNTTSGSSASGNVDLVTSNTQQVGASARRDVSNSTTALIPNTTTFQDTNLVFLFLNPKMNSTQLCTTCTRNILTSYITFESSLPYAPGLNNSLLLSGQTALYNAIVSTCQSGFLSGAVQAAGGLSSGLLNGSPRSISADVSLLVGAILSAAGLAVTAF